MNNEEILSAAYIIWNDLFLGFEKVKKLHQKRQKATLETEKVRLDNELRVAIHKVSVLGEQMIQMDNIVSKSAKGLLA
jgi:hypothetical protein